MPTRSKSPRPHRGSLPGILFLVALAAGCEHEPRYKVPIERSETAAIVSGTQSGSHLIGDYFDCALSEFDRKKMPEGTLSALNYRPVAVESGNHQIGLSCAGRQYAVEFFGTGRANVDLVPGKRYVVRGTASITDIKIWVEIEGNKEVVAGPIFVPREETPQSTYVPVPIIIKK